MGFKKNRRDTSVSVSQDRAEQLRILAEAYDCSPREVVEQWISEGLKELGVSPQGVPYWSPPGMSIRKITINDLGFIELSHEAIPKTLLRLSYVTDANLGEASEALDLAQAIESAAKVNRPWEYDCTKHGGRIMSLRRRGAGVVLTIDDREAAEAADRESAPEVLLSPTMALELADAIRFLCHPSQHPASSIKLRDNQAKPIERELAEAFEVAW